MASDRRNWLVFLLLVAGLGFGLYRLWPSVTIDFSGSRTAAAASSASGLPTGVSDVRLENLEPSGLVLRPLAEPVQVWSITGTRGRGWDTDAFSVGAADDERPPSLPGRSAIGLRFIGYWEDPVSKQRVAALSDDRGVYHGSEGDTVEGRYEILRIDAESIEIAYFDGTGRRTIRLSGS